MGSIKEDIGVVVFAASAVLGTWGPTRVQLVPLTRT